MQDDTRTRGSIALVDCVSFYASCERVFEPALDGRPIIVLSNNDGCVVAASPEAKQIDPDIMGKPWFKIEAWSRMAGVVARSSNYELYGSLSARVMAIIGKHSAWQEVYSIDESFIGLTGEGFELIATGQRIRSEVMQSTGVPVRVAIGATKTLAKVAALGIKRTPEMNGVCDFSAYTPAQQSRILASIPVTDLWGVASRTGKKLAALGIFTAKDLRDADAARIRKRFSVVLARTVLELRGIPCIELEMQPPAQKEQLIFSRSFSRKLTKPDEMAQVTAMYAQRVGQRLRKQGSLAGMMQVWAATGWADEGTPPHSTSVTVRLPAPTDDPIELARAAAFILPKLFPKELPGVRYARLGVVLNDLRPAASTPMLDLFSADDRELGATLDGITQKLGRDAIGVGVGGLKTPPGWEMKRAMLSKRATTEWDELCEAAA
ncbi:Y-family DNA polymerase [Leucobacter aridicollis]|nr:Y-family DNA polymerase [Leucobacter aridicollis]